MEDPPSIQLGDTNWSDVRCSQTQEEKMLQITSLYEYRDIYNLVGTKGQHIVMIL